MKSIEPSFHRKYLVLSHLLGRVCLAGQVVDRVRLERMIAMVVGYRGFAPLHKTSLRALLGVSSMGKRTLPLLSMLLRHASAMATQSTLVLVLDELSDLREDDLDRCVCLVERLLQSGVIVLVLEPNGRLTSLPAIREVVTTNDFIHIYLNDLWLESKSLEWIPQSAEIYAECES